MADRVVVITGAGVGLGRSLARQFATEGDKVVLLGRTASKVETVAAEIGEAALPIGCDVASPDQVRAAFALVAERYGRVDVLINNAAIFVPAAVEDYTDALIRDTFMINLAGPVHCVREALPMLTWGSHIINVSSEAVEIDHPLLTLYEASKAGLDRLNRAFRLELGPRGIRVTLARVGRMASPDKVWDVDPVAFGKFFVACQAIGMDLTSPDISHYDNAAVAVRALANLPVDIDMESISFHGRRSEPPAP
jgi:NAD(P)-dependent dehydrogenase (short-subunit alcohol dehydrogenase family)